eukprot:c744_g1_i1.p1 GENE.c744_g1_i1~~c744_g1_i1.p1  ORF type:complete len:598 (-),score=168.05 c744_g1_i1:67-1860(-)
MKCVWNVIQDVFSLAVEVPYVVIQALRVIEREEIAIEYRAKCGLTSGKEVSKGSFHSECRATLVLAIASRFKILLPPNSTIPMHEFILKVDELIEDLAIVYDDMVPLFPPHYDIFNFCLVQYHTQIFGRLNDISDKGKEDKVSLEDVLELQKFIARYHESFHRFGIENLEPDVTEIGEALMTNYIDQVEKLVREWCDRIHDEDSNAAMTLGSNGLRNDSHINLFKMMHQQLSIAIERQLAPRYILQILGIAERQLLRFAGQQMERLKQEWKTLSLETIVVMINNSHLSEQEFISKLASDTSAALPPELAEGLELSRIEQAFHDIARTGYEVLVDQIADDLDKIIPSYFSQQWLDSRKPILDTVATMSSYLEDLKDILNEFYFKKTIQLCVERWVIAYLKRLLNCKPAIVPAFSQRMLNDRIEMAQMMKKYPVVNAQLIEGQLSVIEGIAKLMDKTEPTSFLLAFAPLAQQFPRHALPLANFVMKYMSPSLPSSTIKEMVESCTLTMKMQEKDPLLTAVNPVRKIGRALLEKIIPQTVEKAPTELKVVKKDKEKATPIKKSGGAKEKPPLLERQDSLDNIPVVLSSDLFEDLPALEIL